MRRSMHAAVLSLVLSPLADGAATATEDATTPEPGPYLGAADGGPRRLAVSGTGSLTLYDQPSMQARTIAELEEDELLMNGGCNRDGDRLWCHVEPLSGRGRGYVDGERLIPARAPDGTVPMGIDPSIRRARGHDFDASADVACAQERGESLGTCAADIARGGGGDAAVLVTFPNGFGRTLRFVNGRFVSADATMSGVGKDIDWSLQGGLHRLRVEDQRYVVPDAFLLGDSGSASSVDPR